MIRSKLCQMLVGLDKKEWKKLEELIRSPYFNKQEKCIELFELLKQGILYQQAEYLDKSFIIKRAFPITDNADNYLRVITRYLTQLVEEFFIQEKLKSQPYYRNHLLHHVFLDKKLFNHYISSNRKIKKINAAKSMQAPLQESKETYFSSYLQALDESKYIQMIEERNTDISILDSVLEKLDQYYWINRLAITVDLLTFKNVLKNENDSIIKPILPNINHLFSNDKHQLLQMYYTAVLALHFPENQDHYLNLEQQLKQHHFAISKNELNSLYTLLSNHLIVKNHRGENRFQKVFQLYQFMVDHDVLVTEKYITWSKFKNIVTLGCLLKQFDWTLQFIKEYRHKLAAQHQDSVYAFNMGFLYFFQQKFTLAQEYLLTVDNFDVFYTMDTKSLLIQIYYETRQLQAVEYMLNPFRDFLRRQKKLNKNIEKGYLNFIKILALIIKAQHKYGSKKVSQNKLLLKLDSYKVIHRRDWLREKINLLESTVL